MVDSEMSVTPQTNFQTYNLPPNTADFYNSKEFAAGEVKYMSSMQQSQQQTEQNLEQVYEEDNIDPEAPSVHFTWCSP